MDTQWFDDIGIDELEEDLFRCIITDASGETVAHVFGKTVEECTERAKLVASVPELQKPKPLSKNEIQHQLRYHAAEPDNGH